MTLTIVAAKDGPEPEDEEGDMVALRDDPKQAEHWLAQSTTHPNVEYELTLGDGHGIDCTCLGYTYKMVCKHTLALAQYLAVGGCELAREPAPAPPSDIAVLAGELQDHIATSRFQERDLLRNPAVAPVRITIGSPRFHLDYALAGTMLRLAPTSTTFALKGRPEFEGAYRAQLDAMGTQAVLELLRDKREETGRDLVLLCFEDMARPGAVCHRRILADWLAERTGLIVPELAPKG